MSRPGPAVPPEDAVRRVIDCLTGIGLAPAVGGSALLVSLGVAVVARDWDVTVDADPDDVRRALTTAGFAVSDHTSHEGPFADGDLLVITADDHHIDVMINAVLHDGDGRFAVSSRSTRSWRGLPMAEPWSWLRVYELLGRSDRADALRQWLADADGQPVRSA